MKGRKFSSISERTSLLSDADRIDKVGNAARRISTIADSSGVRQSFVIHDAAAEANAQSSSVREKFSLWIEANAFLLGSMAISTGLLFLMRFKGFNPLGLSYTIAASPLFFGLVKLTLDLIEPILFGLISWMSSILNWYIVTMITSFSDNLHRIGLTAAMYWWFWYHGQDPWLALFFKASTFSCIVWACKEVCLRFTRRLIIISSIMKSIGKSDLERDAMILLCCPNEETRAEERRRWKNDSYRTSLLKKLEVIEKGALDLPLQPVGENDVAFWKYSSETYIRIKSLHQMRIIAAVLRDNLFEGGRRPSISFGYWCSLFASSTVAEKTWRSLFERDQTSSTDTLTGKDFVWGIYQAFERRKRLTSQYMNLSNLFTILETACNGIYAFIVFTIFGVCLGADVSRLSVTISTTFVALSFAMSGTVTRVFESLVLIFVRKPFEIGDRITLNGEDYFVEKINLMTTVLRKRDARIVQFSNTALSDAAICNHRRSGPAMIDLQFMVSYNTTTSQLQQLKNKMANYVKENADIWGGDIEFLVENLDNSSAVNMTLRCYHRLTWQEKATLDEHRYDLAQSLRLAMSQLKIDTSIGVKSSEVAVAA